MSQEFWLKISLSLSILHIGSQLLLDGDKWSSTLLVVVGIIRGDLSPTSRVMASPIGHLIHHNPPPPPESRSASHPQPPPRPRPPLQPPALTPAYSTSIAGASTGAGTDSNGLSLAPPAASTSPPSVPVQGEDGDATTSVPSLGPSPSQRGGGHANTQSLYQCADCMRMLSPCFSHMPHLTLFTGRYSRPEHLQVRWRAYPAPHRNARPAFLAAGC